MKKIYLLGIILLECLCFSSVASALPDYNQVKIVESCKGNSGAEVEKQVNEFLKEKRIHPSHIVDIKLSISSAETSRKSSTCTTAMIIYHEQ
ncbi:MAG: hypothetical protein ACD_7C00407G0002 [uncultured bacterium]|nr:MAG: hypothetical protein ACD_7C00407G0002 [uncultured bacterium]